jgi:hypothetical protein
MLINDNGTDREATETEIAYYTQWSKDVEKLRKEQAAAQADKASAREALLDRLGLTADEAQLLLGA